MGIANPFTPSFGIVPPYLAGRQDLLNIMKTAFQNGYGDPNLCTILVGPRGSGKTALLSCIGDEAREQGWIVVDVMAESGMLNEVFQHAQLKAASILGNQQKRTLTGVNIGELVGLEWETEQADAPTWRIKMERLLKQMADAEIGLVITVDEVKVNVDEMVRLVSAYQLFVRAGFHVSLVMAGLPAQVSFLMEHRDVSFLRRARQQRLGLVRDSDVAWALRKTIEDAGKHIDAEALELAVKNAQGFPYMIQLVGYYLWQESDEETTIGLKAVERGCKAAQQDFEQGVLERTWFEMSKGDRAFALAMVPDEMGSTLTDVAKRLGRKTNYASTYKKRLLEAGVIGELAGNRFDFELPMMREYVSHQL